MGVARIGQSVSMTSARDRRSWRPAVPRRFWLEFEGVWSRDHPGFTSFLYQGVGITGWDLDDCLAMLKVVAHVDELPALRTVEKTWTYRQFLGGLMASVYQCGEASGTYP